MIYDSKRSIDLIWFLMSGASFISRYLYIHIYLYIQWAADLEQNKRSIYLSLKDKISLRKLSHLKILEGKVDIASRDLDICPGPGERWLLLLPNYQQLQYLILLDHLDLSFDHHFFFTFLIKITPLLKSHPLPARIIAATIVTQVNQQVRQRQTSRFTFI